MSGINEIYQYIDEMIAEQRRAMLEKRPATKLTGMFVELKTKLHTMRRGDPDEKLHSADSGS